MCTLLPRSCCSSSDRTAVYALRSLTSTVFGQLQHVQPALFHCEQTPLVMFQHYLQVLLGHVRHLQSGEVKFGCQCIGGYEERYWEMSMHCS